LTYKNLQDCSKQIPDLKKALIDQLSKYRLPGGPDKLLTDLGRLGILGLYPDRASGFRQFLRFWDIEDDIAIAGSTLEGFRKALGVDPRKLLEKKLRGSPKSRIRILLTHPSLISYREKQEEAKQGAIGAELAESQRQLVSIRQNCKAGDRLAWKFFRGAPTCFMISAGDYMLLNPYLYMQSAIFNFSLIVWNTGSDFDIYNRYDEYHFERAWANSKLSSTGSQAWRSTR
jgi:hypothetical protein